MIPAVRTQAHVRFGTWLILALSGAVAIAFGPASSPADRQTAGTTDTATAQYLANAGVLVTRGTTKVVFDPLFRNDFGTYERVPASLERALFAGESPFDGLDAVFVSHYHEDHFSAADVLRLLEARREVRLYAPAQAVAGMRELAPGRLDAVIDRVQAIALQHGDAPVTIERSPLVVDAVRIPHTGWPGRQQHVENLAFRVTLGADTTVVHLGDADPSDAHFARDGAYWARRRTTVAFPPYWFFLSETGREVLAHRIAPVHAIGVHVPADVPGPPADRAPELRGHELFTEPGERRTIR
jgi:L-ascorbate metabolism protein UlaG (beta-lactamase superfamily)